MFAIQRPPNRFLQALPDAEFELLRPRLKPFEMVKETALAESGAVGESRQCAVFVPWRVSPSLHASHPSCGERTSSWA